MEQVPTGVTVVPTVEVVGPAGRVVINKSDLGDYLQRGYQPIDAEAVVPAGDAGGAAGGDAGDDEG